MQCPTTLLGVVPPAEGGGCSNLLPSLLFQGPQGPAGPPGPAGARGPAVSHIESICGIIYSLFPII